MRKRKKRGVFSSFSLSIVIHLVLAILIAYAIITEKTKENTMGVDIVKVEQKRVKPRSLSRPLLQRKITKVKPRITKIQDINHRVNLPKTYANFRIREGTGNFALPEGFSRTLKRDFTNIKPKVNQVQVKQSSISSVAMIQSEINTKFKMNTPSMRSGLMSSSKIEKITLNSKKNKMIELISAIKRKVESSKRYPRQARESGYEGTVVVLFQIGKDGNLKGVEIIGSSGYMVLDDAAIRMVKRASPFPSVEEYVTDEDGLSLKIPIDFRLKEA